tara:strand:- start:880 stop:4704 length:3825 start_codon:yes stop_codon:yes gene_type:complete
MGRLVGQGIETYVTDQINTRQIIAGSGIGDTSRSVDFLQIQNNRNAWLKLGSSVKVLTAKEMLIELQKDGKNPNLTEKIIEESRTTGIQRLKDMDIPNPETFMGIGLATEAVLFNSLSKVNPADWNEKGYIPGTYTFRSGVTGNQSLWNNNAYGLGGNPQGLVPPPGLIDAKIDALNRGSIRKAVVNIKAHNKFQFELIELLYLRLGYTMLLEWGWDKYIDNPSEGIKQMSNTLMETNWFYSNDKYNTSFRDVIKNIESFRILYKGNYDGFVGRVSNFSWDFDSDGTYNITLNLITVGDVVESLKINHPQKSINKDDITRKITEYNKSDSREKGYGGDQKLAGDAAIVTNAGNSTLSYDLFIDIIDISTEDKWFGGYYGKYDSNYFNLFNSFYGGKILPTKTFSEKENETTTLTYSDDQYIERDKYGYFLTFRELINKIQQLCIHSVSNNSIINIDNETESNLMVAYPNQISLDPRVCFTKPAFSTSLTYTNNKDNYINPDGVHRNLKEWFTVDENNTNCVYGKIMNLYINYDFISKCLEKTTKKGEVFLFKFLQNLCDGINSAMGNVNNLEPIIEDDFNIKIQDQNKIRGIETSKYKDRFKEDDDFDFELFGYNPTNSTSNIIRKFNFETKITPDLASMISIGATSNGTSTKNYDATAFSNWNSGLRDQYQLNFTDPLDEKIRGEIEGTVLTENDKEMLSASFAASDIDTNVGADWFPVPFTGTKPSATKSTKALGIEFEGTRNPKNNDLIVINLGVYYDWETYVSLAEGKKLANLAEENRLKNIKNKNIDAYGFGKDYIRYLMNGFGGKFSKSLISRNLYYALNPDFIKTGKTLFKAYVDNIDNTLYEKYGDPSTKIGFIPLDLSLESDGISGIKIYNRLNIKQTLLPKQYPKSVEFLIKNVNHTISDNDWSTELKTLSTPKTNSHLEDSFNLNEVTKDIVNKTLFVFNGLKTSLTTGINVENLNSRTGLIFDPTQPSPPKTQIVLHHTAGNQTSEGYINGWKKFSYPIATHYIIPREGQTEQVFADEYWSNHLGTSTPNTPALQKGSLSIEISNYGYLTLKKNQKGDFAWTTWSGQEVPGDQVVEPYQIWEDGRVIPMHGGYRGFGRFQKYTEGQIKALENILRKWKSKYPNIPQKLTYDNFKDLFPKTNKTSDNALAKFPGLYTHNSYRTDKLDIFPQKELLEMLMGLDGESTTTTTSSSTFTYYPQFAKVTEEVNNKEVKVTIEYDDGTNIGTAVGEAVASSRDYRKIAIAKSSATLKAKGYLANIFNN